MRVERVVNPNRQTTGIVTGVAGTHMLMPWCPGAAGRVTGGGSRCRTWTSMQPGCFSATR